MNMQDLAGLQDALSTSTKEILNAVNQYNAPSLVIPALYTSIRIAVTFITKHVALSRFTVLTSQNLSSCP